jgi:hypothetical protein
MSISTNTTFDSTYFPSIEHYGQYMSTLSTTTARQSSIVSAPPVLITLEQLMVSTTSLQSIESSNKQKLESFDKDIFMQNLQAWAGTGFQDSYVIYDLPLITSTLSMGKFSCSDGTARDVWAYIPFCLGYPITKLVNTFQVRATGMKFSFSVVTDPVVSLKIHVSKS